ncbi:MAG: DUF423 domain-containing protein [Chloroflexi bacterium]|nr:DUF423 domain-containing protein [Chloroflexota bacterium]
MTSRNFVLLAALFGFLGVGLGAFGAHGLSAYFAAHPDLQDDFRTATQYHLYHTLALIGAAWVAERYPGRWSRWAGILFAVGIVLFAGSLYILALTNLRIMGAVAPLGGLALLGGWASLGLAAWQGSKKP